MRILSFNNAPVSSEIADLLEGYFASLPGGSIVTYMLTDYVSAGYVN